MKGALAYKSTAPTAHRVLQICSGERGEILELGFGASLLCTEHGVACSASARGFDTGLGDDAGAWNSEPPFSFASCSLTPPAGGTTDPGGAEQQGRAGAARLRSWGPHPGNRPPPSGSTGRGGSHAGASSLRWRAETPAPACGVPPRESRAPAAAALPPSPWVR